jgi:hypothetical protein
MDIEVKQNRAWSGEDTYTVKIISNKTGKEEVVYPDAHGGLFIMNSQKAATPFATDQGAFGDCAAIAISLYKLPAVMRDVVKRQPEIAAVLIALEQAVGEPWEIQKAKVDNE